MSKYIDPTNSNLYWASETKESNMLLFINMGVSQSDNAFFELKDGLKSWVANSPGSKVHFWDQICSKLVFQRKKVKQIQ